MKTSAIPYLALCLLMSLAQSGPLQAQFFKDILNTVKQTAQGRANSKASQTTNKALDKVDSSTSGKGGKKVSGTSVSPRQQSRDTGQPTACWVHSPRPLPKIQTILPALI